MAFIEFKEKGRKLINSRWSCDFCSEELLQSVLYDDIVKNNEKITRSEIQNNWNEIQNKLKRSQEDDDCRMIGSDYEFRKYMKLSERIERDNSGDRNRERYKSRDSRSRSRERGYRPKRSRSRSRGRDSPRRKKSKKRPVAIIERVHSPRQS